MTQGWQHAIIILANWKYFSPAERIEYRKVQSRFLVWCKSGSGRLTVNGQEFPVSPGVWLLAPWNHRIVYQASAEEPFLLGCVHLIPSWPPEQEPQWQVFHELPQRHSPPSSFEFPDGDSPHVRLRADRVDPEFAGIRHGWAAPEDPLLLLGEYIVSCFCPQPYSAAMMRHLARVLLEELHVHGRVRAEKEQHLPLQLQQMLNTIELMLEEKFNLGPLQKNANCSRATVYRLFRQYLHTTPNKWAMRRKMTHAAALLLSSSLAIGEIADRLAIPDHYYFSKLFRQHFGTPALAYRKNHGR